MTEQATTTQGDTARGGTPEAPFPLTDLQAAYLVGASPLMELGGFRPTLYYELDMVAFDPARAEEAVRRLVHRHEHLRTVMLAEGEQRVLGDDELEPFRLHLADLTALTPEQQESAILRTRHRMRDQGPDPTGWPLFEITAQRLRPHRTRVHLAMSLLLLDSGSTRRLQDEWWQLYLDPTAELPPVTGTFRACLLSLAEAERSGAHQAHWQYWESRLDTLPDAPQLPLARRPATISPVRLTRRSFVLGREQWQRFRANARAHRIMPTTALLHVYAEVLGAWAGSPRFCLNVLHQNWVTRHPEAEGVVGQFSATLPLEVDLAESGDFWARAARVQRRLWRDLEHADVTGVRVTRELAGRRGWTSGAVLPYVFNSMLGPAEQRTPLRRPVCRTVHTGLRTPQVLVDNQAKNGPDGGIECVWDVVDEAFPTGLPDALFDAYRRMVETLAGPDGARVEPDPVPPAHRQLVSALNAPAAPPEGRLEDGFLRQAREHPDAPAVVTSGRTLTYGELEAVSRAAARWLGERGIGRGDVVPVVMAKGWEQVAAVLGVLRAGAAYCPVDAGLPAERIRHLLDACSARALLGQSHRVPDPGALGTLPALPVDLVEPSGDPAPNPPDRSPDDLAYIIHTSGSTGVPKGVMIRHRAALNTVLDVNERIGLGAPDRVFGISSLSFDLSVWDIFGSLAAGAALVLPDATPRPDPLGWAESAHRHGVTVWNSVPALAEMLVEVAEQRPELGKPPVRAFLMSGDWIPPTLPGRMRRLTPDVRVIAMGGATEASIWSNIHEVEQVDPAWRSIPYGVPLRGQTMRILDHRLEVRPPWATGGIHIGGAGLASGYAGDLERTEEQFIRHPETGERLYRTGDLGRYRPDGTIEFLGREDRQLKIQGFRVEPGEVESAIRDCPGVAECAVCAAPVPGGQQRLVALVVPGDGAAPEPTVIAERLATRLPSYMVPGLIQVVDRLPLTANGKVDAAALASLAATRPASDTAPQTGRADSTPGTPGGADGSPDGRVLKQLAEVWAELLQVEQVGPDSDFFALGGNSLLALRLLNRIRTELGTEVQFGQIFEAPTLRALAARVAEDGRQSGCAVTLSRGTGTELFLFHPVGGSVTSYLGLARAWPGPVHAFQSRALAQGTDPAVEPDLVSMAASYLGELLRLTPEGPYLLGGWSMGGVLAYEVARLLAEQGHRADVFMIDSSPVERRLPGSESAGHLEFLRDLAGGRLPEGVAATVTAADRGEPAAAAREAAVRHGLLPPETDLAGYRRLMRLHAHNLAVLGAHRPGPSELPTLLFAAGAEERRPPSELVDAWRALCPDIDVVVRPRDHYSIVADDESAAIAERVTAWLTEPHPTRNG
ncbi:non-ribosomal peptide synthetase [Peterkaempfera bronchialis]|uniref:non-ribosomal peptide synthetase n=1 Tax=Peterkaempfera bronchialis TaxID=2126346 RepID=UPI003C2AC26D